MLEIGFGHGHVLFWFRPPTSIYGIELSPKALADARRRAERTHRANAVFAAPEHGTTPTAGFADATFDVVTASHTIEHVPDDVSFVRDALRVTKPGGLLMLLAPLDVSDLSEALCRDERLNPAFPETSYHVWRYNLASLVDVVEAAGGVVTEAVACDAIADERRGKKRISQVLGSVVWAIAPHTAWESADAVSQRKGYRCRQGLVVATRAASERGHGAT